MKAITIVGGGLAGLALGTALRRRGVPVELYEAGTYPRHRVCGEFISGKGQESLDRLGLLHCLNEARLCTAQTAAFFSSRRCYGKRRLPKPAVTISRFVLDSTLAEQFTSEGGKLLDHTRWLGDFRTEGVVRACGRRPQATSGHLRWFGLKAHAANIGLEADLEMHLLPNCYVGLCRLPGALVNVCGLFWSDPKRNDFPALKPLQLLSGKPGTLLHGRLAHAEWDDASICAVAGLPVHEPWPHSEVGEVAVGDALNMPPPITGNGMSLAFESAEIACNHLESFARGTMSWPQLRRDLHKRYSLHFARRIQYANCLHRVLIRFPMPLLCAAAINNSLWNIVFRITR